MSRTTRRNFLKTLLASGAALAVPAKAVHQQVIPRPPKSERKSYGYSDWKQAFAGEKVNAGDVVAIE